MSGRDLFGRPLPTTGPGLDDRANRDTGMSFRLPNHGPTPRPVPRSAAAEDAKLEAFRKLKPTCVQLMGLAGQPPTPTSRHAALVDTLRAAVETLPDDAFAPSLINYLLFPITTILRHSTAPAALPDAFLEAAFRLLAVVVRHWHAIPGGMDVGAWEQLWRFAAAVGVSSGGAGGSGKGDKGKGREVGQEVMVQALSLLSALLDPSSSSGTPHPTPAMRRLVTGTHAPLVPTVFQSITLAVSCTAPDPPHAALQRSAVAVLRTLLTYLAGQAELLASVLPGVVSAMARAIAAGGKGLKGDIAEAMAGVVGEVVVETLDDTALRRLGVLRPAWRDLSDLADMANEWRQDNEPKDTSINVDEIDGLDDDDDGPTTPQPESSKAVAPNPFPPLTPAYLAFTATQLQATIPPVLATLTAHSSHLARTGAAALASELIAHCHESLPRLTLPALSALLLLSTDEFDPVRDDALSRLQCLLDDSSDTGAAPELDAALVDLLSSAINSLPRLIRSEQDTRVAEAARVVTAIARVNTVGRPNVIAAFLGASGHVERWAGALLDCLEFGRPVGWSAGTSAARTAEQGWGGGLITSSLPLLIEGSASEAGPGNGAGEDKSGPAGPPPDAKFPHLPLRHVENERTARAISGMLEALGAAGGEAALYSVDYFVRYAKAHRGRQPGEAVSAVWVAELLLRGVAGQYTDKKPRAVRKMAREVVRTLVAMDDEEDEDEGDEGMREGEEQAESDALLPIERTQGIDTITTLLDRPRANASASAETRRLHARAQRVLLTCVSLQALSGCAHVLGAGFRPLLLHALYGVLAALSSPHALVREYAEIALARIAYEAGYASAQNLVLDNVDYVVNVVSQRLTYARLSPHAPLVLIAMIRLVGAPIVPLVHDVVDEIFDALDDYHGYAALASALLAVLNTLIDAMAVDVESGTGEDEPMAEDDPRAAERRAEAEAAKRLLVPPDPAADFARFKEWYSARTQPQAEMDAILERAPGHAWGKYAPGEKGDPDNANTEADPDAMDEDPPANATADEDPPPTRTQEVCAQILTKASYYLSHGAPFLRARVLALMARAVPVLAPREALLLPIIDRAWPAILRRLDDVPYVTVEAAGLVAALAEYVGTYVARRIADDAWPEMLKVMRAQARADEGSALSRRSRAQAGQAPHSEQTQSEYTISHRLHLSLVSTATFIASSVPVKDRLLWDMALAFRPLLDAQTHPNLRAATLRLYAALNARDGDAVYVALMASVGEMKGDRGVWSYLRVEGGEGLREGVKSVLGLSG